MNEAETSGRIEREMGLDHADFWRLLPRAAGANRWQRDADRVRIDLDGGQVEIALGVEGVRRIALMAIPVTPVTITWNGIAPGAFGSFLEAFDRVFQRGGG